MKLSAYTPTDPLAPVRMHNDEILVFGEEGWNYPFKTDVIVYRISIPQVRSDTVLVWCDPTAKYTLSSITQSHTRESRKQGIHKIG